MVGFARDNGLRVSAYGGGHNLTGNAVCDHGVTTDLRPPKGIEIDPRAFTTGRIYVNFIGDEGEERVVASFGAEGYRRLQSARLRRLARL